MPGATGCSYRVAVSRLDGAPNFAMRVFEVATGGNTPLHQHPYEHEVFIIEGAGTVWRDGTEVALNPGNILFVPADERHQFKNTGSGPLKFICLIPGEFQKC
jgi:quercetin dioxygenase-like cupin family protein